MTSRTRLPSDKNYYPTIAELLTVEPAELSSFTGRSNKATLECLLREALSQLADAKAQNNGLVQRLASNESKFEEIKEVVINKLESAMPVQASSPSAQNQAQKEPAVPRPKAVSQSILCQISIDGIPEATTSSPENPDNTTSIVNQEAAKVKEVLDFLDERPTIVDARRLGKFKPSFIEKRTRPRSTLLTVANVWEAKQILGKASLLRGFTKFKAFLSPSLSQEDIIKERKVLKKRRELINSGVQAKSLKIKNFQLFLDNVLVDDLTCEDEKGPPDGGSAASSA